MARHHGRRTTLNKRFAPQRPLGRVSVELGIPVDSAPNEHGTRYFGGRRGDEYKREQQPGPDPDSAA